MKQTAFFNTAVSAHDHGERTGELKTHKKEIRAVADTINALCTSYL